MRPNSGRGKPTIQSYSTRIRFSRFFRLVSLRDNCSIQAAKSTMIRSRSRSELLSPFGVYRGDEDSYSQDSSDQKVEETETTAWTGSENILSERARRTRVARTISRCVILLTLVGVTVGTSLIVAKFSRDADEEALQENVSLLSMSALISLYDSILTYFQYYSLRDTQLIFVVYPKCAFGKASAP